MEKALLLLEPAQGDDVDLGPLDVLAEAYEKLGDLAKLREARRLLFEQSVSKEDFASCLACLPEAERAKAKKNLGVRTVLERQLSRMSF